MAKKPVIEDTLDSVTEIEETPPEPASTEPVAPDGYVLVKQADWDELQRNLKMAR